jgi:TatD DNase family protein
MKELDLLPLVDSHCHLNRLDLTSFDNSLDNALNAARAVGVKNFLTVSVERSDIIELKKLSEHHQDIYYSVGWHPTSVEAQDIRDWLLEEGQFERCVAIGETGLDYYHMKHESEILIQQDIFRQHISAAKQLSKPLIIHTRQSSADTVEILHHEGGGEVVGVMHCFTEDWQVAKKALDLGFMISLSGIVTFKNAHLVHEVAQKTPIDRLLIETDSPYLAPVPHRGKSNHPAWVYYVACAIGTLRGMSAHDVAFQTTQNFNRLFLGK